MQHQLYLCTFYRDNPYSGITAEAMVCDHEDALNFFQRHQEEFATIFPDAKDDPDNDEILDVRGEEYLSYENLDDANEYRFEISKLTSSNTYHSLK